MEMEFLVRIEVCYPADGDETRKRDLISAERERAAELVQEGTIVRLWRIPGRWANVGVWYAEDATELHEALASLPFAPWLDVTVEPLANHPSDPEGPTSNV